ncbi:gamma-glutamylcyclotransferase [Halomonas litopenaei]|uniref:gamma-glutamylcyclotransferase n=1 Tax=Halomonas litopenaei TaxID=2109328 RepID=UPI001F5CF1E6|nr:gamma-glutamylcyclotransferase [Halomonas litopenaei]
MQDTDPTDNAAPMSSADTREINRRQGHFASQDTFWLFGYGSLIWKADIAYRKRRPALIHGYSRRFWQGSHDHRGTPDAPGRVATLVREEGASCLGMAYLIGPEALSPLDLREKNGYLRASVTLHFVDHGTNGDQPRNQHQVSATPQTATGLVYIASSDNPAYLGDAPVDHIVQQIARSHGPSGPNSDYLLNLADALSGLGGDDAHVFQLAQRLRQRMRQAAPQSSCLE